MALKKLFWIDMEMTGLDVEKEVIIEVALIVTDLDFKILETYHEVIKQDQKYIDAMDDWNKTHHGASGLIDQIPTGKPLEKVETEILAILDKFSPGERGVLAGNSIGQDRLFINKYMPKLKPRLHYRMLDVTSWKIILAAKFDLKHEKKNSHRALDDIRESISELQFYLAHFNPAKVPVETTPQPQTN